jgi:hypothetical protein
MNIFDLRERLVRDYSEFIRGCGRHQMIERQAPDD